MPSRKVAVALPASHGTAFYNELTVKASADGTYFMACGWSKGYFGIQELANGKKLLVHVTFSTRNREPSIPEELELRSRSGSPSDSRR